jgi:hypothetical protein
MSLAIQASTVRAVLLADGWHEIEPGSFDIDAYEIGESYDAAYKGGLSAKFDCWHGGGQSGVCATGFGVCATGFEFVTADGSGTVRGPLTAVLALNCGSSR